MANFLFLTKLIKVFFEDIVDWNGKRSSLVIIFYFKVKSGKDKQISHKALACSVRSSVYYFSMDFKLVSNCPAGIIKKCIVKSGKAKCYYNNQIL